MMPFRWTSNKSLITTASRSLHSPEVYARLQISAGYQHSRPYRPFSHQSQQYFLHLFFKHLDGLSTEPPRAKCKTNESYSRNLLIMNNQCFHIKCLPTRSAGVYALQPYRSTTAQSQVAANENKAGYLVMKAPDTSNAIRPIKAATKTDDARDPPRHVTIHLHIVYIYVIRIH